MNLKEQKALLKKLIERRGKLLSNHSREGEEIREALLIRIEQVTKDIKSLEESKNIKKIRKELTLNLMPK